MPKISFIAAALVTYSKQQSAILGRPGGYAASLADEKYKSEKILKENIWNIIYEFVRRFPAFQKNLKRCTNAVANGSSK